MTDQQRRLVSQLDYIDGRIMQALDELEQTGLTNKSNAARNLKLDLQDAQAKIIDLIKAAEDGSVRA